MDIPKFLLLDFLIFLAGTVFLISFRLFFKSSYPSNQFNNKEPLNLANFSIPELSTLIDLEVRAKKEGNVINFDNLMGSWKFIKVWKKTTDLDDYFSSYLLRLFEATLHLIERDDLNNEFPLRITNSIQFGTLSLRFSGNCNLKGKQPLLNFYFEDIELSFGPKLIYRKTLDIPQSNKRPFFALVALDNKNKWLAARGRGGGLALWVKQ